MQTRRWNLIARLSVLFLVLTPLLSVATRTVPPAQATLAAQETESAALRLPNRMGPGNAIRTVCRVCRIQYPMPQLYD